MEPYQYSFEDYKTFPHHQRYGMNRHGHVLYKNLNCTVWIPGPNVDGTWVLLNDDGEPELVNFYEMKERLWGE